MMAGPAGPDARGPAGGEPHGPSGREPHGPLNAPLGDEATHQRFLELTLAQRTNEDGRALLDGEWRYIRTLLGARAERPLDVLDLACGSGHQSLAWAERGHRVTGIDFDRALLVAARERVRRASNGRLAVDWADSDATLLPFRTASFDVVFNNSLLEHVPAWEKVVAETARVLKPGGIYVMATTNRWSPRQQEVNNFPFYSWLPDPIQRRVLAWIMKNRRDLVNFTDFPAVNWFTFGGMRRAFRRAGMEPYDRLDLLSRMGAPGMKGALSRILVLHDVCKWPYYVGVPAMALYGVRR